MDKDEGEVKRERVREGGWAGGSLCGAEGPVVPCAEPEAGTRGSAEDLVSEEDLAGTAGERDVAAPVPVPEEEEGGGERSSPDEGDAETSSQAWLVLADARDRVWDDAMGAEGEAAELDCMDGGSGSVEVVGS